MSKIKGPQGVLFPDWEALGKRYQVFKNFNFETTDYTSWDSRLDKLIWRGSSPYHGWTSPFNLKENRRIQLCQLSKEFPNLIDAGLTYCVGMEPDSFLNKIKETYSKKFISWEEKYSYKYQIWIDGHCSSYGCSGWPLYSGSTVLKTDSDWIQWYYEELIPGTHYVPVKEDLSDLIDQLLCLKNHQNNAKQVAQNSQKFAQEHINYEIMLLYIKELLSAYSVLPTRK